MSLYLLLLMGAFMVLTTAQPLCDPQTEYEQDGQCCKMCNKGTSMVPNGSCQYPLCQECPEGDYQEGYTKERLCKRQPYCDPNLNFEKPVHSKTAKTICKCKEGFHCSSEDCKGCLPNSVCEPGFWVQRIGSHAHDTECMKCPNGTFSDEPSFSRCKEWKRCEGPTEVEGTSTSDRKCAPSRLHIVAICVPVVIGVIVALIVVFFKCKGHMKKKAKPCIELCRGDEHQPLGEADIKTPVEDEVDPSLPETSSEDQVTLRGNPVREEDGKSEIISRQESQPEAYSSLI